MGEKENKEWENKADKYAFYAMQRIDLLLISVSFAGIYAAWEIFKFMLGRIRINYSMLQISCVLFLLCIISNFLGQWCSFNAHWHYEDDSKNEKFAQFILPLNLASMLSLILGLILLGVFIFLCLNQVV